MATLAPGININNGIYTSKREMIEDLQDKAIDMNLLFNTNFDLDGTTMKFIAPFNLPVQAQAKADIPDNGCKRTITCVGGEDFDVPLDQWLDEQYAFKRCAVNMLSPKAINSAYATYVKNWRNAEVNYSLTQLAGALTAAIDVDTTTIVDTTEDMIAQLEDNGFSREDMVVLYSGKAASAFRKLGYACCTLRSQFAPDEVVNNKFDVKRVVDVKNKLNGLADIMVYIQAYALYGDYCKSSPEIYDGTNEYKGRSIISGEEGFGFKMYAPEVAGLKYTIPEA